MLERSAYGMLASWKEDASNVALLVDGARQIGKTFLIEEFAKREYPSYIKVDFIEDSQLAATLAAATDVRQVIEALTLVSGQAVTPGRTQAVALEGPRGRAPSYHNATFCRGRPQAARVCTYTAAVSDCNGAARKRGSGMRGKLHERFWGALLTAALVAGLVPTPALAEIVSGPVAAEAAQADVQEPSPGPDDTDGPSTAGDGDAQSGVKNDDTDTKADDVDAAEADGQKPASDSGEAVGSPAEGDGDARAGDRDDGAGAKADDGDADEDEGDGGALPSPQVGDDVDIQADEGGDGSQGGPVQVTAEGTKASGEWGTCPWEISDSGVLTVGPGNGASQQGKSESPWYAYRDDITSVAFARDGDSMVVAPASCTHLLYGLSGVTTVDVSGLDTSATETMRAMFYGCSSLEGLDLSGLDTSKVTDMGYMFTGCTSLTSLDLSGWDTSKVTTMLYMFHWCSGLRALDLSGWDTSKVTDMEYMFFFCSNLASLDLSGWDTSGVANMGNMFGNDSSLRTIYAGESWSTGRVTESPGMFGGCTHLVGGKGTTFNESHTDAEYARIDGGPQAPGYLTRALAEDGDTYTISNAAGWNEFCSLLEKHDNAYFHDKTVYLDDDISVTRMAGSSGHDFAGTFDGQGHTLTVDYASAEKYAAPFRYVQSGCVIEHLRVAGTIRTSAQNAAGIVGEQWGEVAIRDCRSSVTIRSSVAGDGTHGGLVAIKGNSDTAELTIEGCVFDGAIVSTGDTATTKCGGFVGWRKDSGSLAIRDCLYAPAADAAAVTDGATFSRNGGTIENCYYTQALGAEQGKQVCRIAAGEGVTLAPAGEATAEYATSGITAYGTGISYGGALYAGDGETVALALGHGDAPEGYAFDGYEASAGTLAADGNLYTLVVDGGAVVSAKWVACIASGTWGTCPWYITREGALVVLPGTGSFTGGDCPWGAYKDDVTSVTFAKKGDSKVVAPADCQYLLSGLSKATSVDASGLDTSAATDMRCMFWNCSSLESLDTTGWDTGKVANVNNMFSNCSSLGTLDLSGWDTGSVTSMYGVFQDCSELETLDTTGWETSGVKTMSAMFYGCSKLASLDLSGWDTSRVTSMGLMFEGCSSLRTIYVGESWSTELVSSSANMFYGCTSLVGGAGTTYNAGHRDKEYARIDGDGGPGYLTGKPIASGTWGTCPWTISSGGALTVGPGTGESQQGMEASPWDAYKDDITSVTFAEKDGSKVVAPADCSYLLRGLKNVTSVDVSGLDTSAATNMGRMFMSCSSLGTLDLSGLDVSHVTNMRSMFYGCSSLETLGTTGWDTRAVTNMSSMFYLCSSLRALDLSGLDVTHVTDMTHMFYGCSSLETLDLSGWDTSGVTWMSYMFSDSPSLKTIYVGDSWTLDSITYSSCMFSGCTSIEGGEGTVYSSDHVDAEYARVDGGPQAPGYLTRALAEDGDTYTISNAAGWNEFCSLLEKHDNAYFHDKTVCLDADIAVTRMAGSSGHDFAGTFDGRGHTLTVDYDSAEKYAAPFRYVDGCAIEHLRVAGTIRTSAQNAAGIVGEQWGTVAIRDCRSSVTIRSGVAGDGTHGGLVAIKGNSDTAELTIEGCVFDGAIVSTGATATTKCGGFVGWRKDSGSLAIRDCLYAPAADAAAVTDGATFSRNGGTFTNCYYTQLLGTAQGKQLRSITAGEGVTLAPAGEATEYATSGITTYGTGIGYGGALYAGEGDEVSLALGHGDGPEGGEFAGYEASAGTLTEDGEGYVLTMPDADVTVSATWAGANEFTVTWLNGDGSTLKTETVAGGVTPAYSGATPTKAATDQYTYAFAGWDPEPAPVTGDVTYEPVFDQTTRTYAVTWKDGDGETLKVEMVAYGATPAYEGPTPTKAATDEFTYAFNGGWSPEVVPVAGAATYEAQFSETTRTYAVTWVDGDGHALRTDDVPYGEVPEYKGGTPTKASSARYDYAFNGTWDPEPAAVTGDAAYEAQFDATTRKYAVTFVDEDGTTVLLAAATYEYGTTADQITRPADPTKASTQQYSYTFDKWVRVSDNAEGVQDVTGDATYKATYTETARPNQIVTQPVSTTARAGDRFTLTVEASGNVTSYKWQASRDGEKWSDVKWSGHDGDTLSYTMQEALDGRMFRCVVTFDDSSETSDVVSVTLPPASRITSHPQDATVAEGQRFELTVVAEGATGYSWQASRNGSSWSDVTWGGHDTATLGYKMVASLDNRQFRCVVTFSDGTTETSEAATLTLATATTGRITAQPQGATVAEGQRFELTVVAEGATGYSWQASRNGTSWSDVAWAGHDTATLGYKMVASLAGRQFRCVVTFSDGTTETSEAATLTLATATTGRITAQPQGATVAAGDRFELSVTAEDATGYSWQASRNGTSWSDVTWSGHDTATLGYKMVTSLDNRQFRCVVTFSDGATETSEVATITLAKEE